METCTDAAVSTTRPNAPEIGLAPSSLFRLMSKVNVLNLAHCFLFQAPEHNETKGMFEISMSIYLLIIYCN